MVELRKVTVRFGDRTVLNEVSFSLARGERVALTGPSGCGKTTLLRVVAGLQKPDGGAVRVGTDKLAFLFQEPRLLPWRTAAENVALVMGDEKACLPAAREWLERFGLDAAAGAKYPAELSGGMRQRTALARTMAAESALVLLDEPFKELDADMREAAIACVAEACGGKTLLLVTHDPREAAALGCTLREFDTL